MNKIHQHQKQYIDPSPATTRQPNRFTYNRDMPPKGTKRKQRSQGPSDEGPPPRRIVTEDAKISHLQLCELNNSTSYYSSFTAKLISVGMVDPKSGGFSQLWRDSNGYEIRSRSWGPLTTKIQDLITPGNTYTVTKFKVHSLDPSYKRKGSNEKYQVLLVKQTTFNLMEMDEENVPTDKTYTLYEWGELDCYEVGDLNVILLEVLKPDDSFGNGRERYDFVLIDQSGCTAILSWWGRIGEKLYIQARINDVIVLRHVFVETRGIKNFVHTCDVSNYRLISTDINSANIQASQNLISLKTFWDQAQDQVRVHYLNNKPNIVLDDYYKVPPNIMPDDFPPQYPV